MEIQITENQKNNLFSEVRYIDTDVSQGYNDVVRKKNWQDVYNQEPIKNDDRIRVFHGCDLKTAVQFAKEGLSGKQWQPRKYSYEVGMNPIGLFVSTSFNKVKQFSNPFNGGKEKNASVIIEFTAKASDLDTPVWNGQDSYFGQNTNPQPFQNKEDRNKQKEHYNDFASKDEHEYVRNSDNKAMAYNIFNNVEHQALFIGNLNPNMIKRFWVKPSKKEGYYWLDDSKEYIPLKRNKFLKQYGDTEFYVDRDRDYKEIYSEFRSQKIYKPNDDFTSIKDLAKRIVDKWALGNKFVEKKKAEGKYNYEKEIQDKIEEIKQIFEWGEYDYLKELLWPKQLIQLMGKEEYEKHYDRFGIGTSNLNENTDILNNEGFKSWFGNSLAVDKEGNPLEMHHLTDSEFDTFSHDYIKGGGCAYHGFGFNFSRSGYGGYGKNDVMCYLRAEHPLTNKEKTINRRLLTKIIKEIDSTCESGDDSIVNNMVAFDPKMTIRHPKYDFYLSKTVTNILDYSEDNLDIYAAVCQAFGGSKKAAIDVFNKYGFDSSIEYDKYNDLPSTIVVFYPNQIKSVKNTSFNNDEMSFLKETRDLFPNSKVRNEDGSLKPMYRGDDNDIETFDRSHSASSNLYGTGFYFTDDEYQASVYGRTTKYYLNIENPLSTDKLTITPKMVLKFLKAIDKNEDYGLYNYGYGSTPRNVLTKVYSTDSSDFSIIQDINACCIGDMVEATLLFNKLNKTTFDGFILSTETVVFDNSQIMKANDLNENVEDDEYMIGSEGHKGDRNMNYSHVMLKETLSKLLCEWGRNSIPDISQIGEFVYDIDFDEDEYQEYLQEWELQDTLEEKIKYIKENVYFNFEFLDNVYHHTLSYAELSYDDIENIDEVGEELAKVVLKDCLEDGHGRIEKILLFNDDVNVDDPKELNAAALRILPHGEYFKGCRGFILTDGNIVYTEAEHNHCSEIPGIKGTFDFIKRGNIRILTDSMDVWTKPTIEQRRIIANIVRYYRNESLIISVKRNGKEEYRQFDNPNAELILRYIDSVYGINENINKKLVISEDQKNRIFLNKKGCRN